MNYSATFSFEFEDPAKKGAVTRMHYIPLKSFQVIGGAARTIELRTTDDISISSEFEQARSYKNITLYLPPREGHEDMQAALYLTDLAINKQRFGTYIRIDRISNGKVVEELMLVDYSATLLDRPSMTPKNSLMVDISIPNAELMRRPGTGDSFKRY